jgi:hypothetical protein
MAANSHVSSIVGKCSLLVSTKRLKQFLSWIPSSINSINGYWIAYRNQISRTKFQSGNPNVRTTQISGCGSEIRCYRRVSISSLSNMVNSSDQQILLKSYVNSMTSQIWWTIICSNWIWIFWCNFVFNIFRISTWSSKCLGSTNTDEINRNCSMQVNIMNGIFAFICLRPMKQEVISKLLSYRNLHFW